jgi:hypothetical protein
MSRSFTTLELRTRLRELCDIEGDPFFTDTSLNSLLSAAYAKYYAELVKHGLGYASEKQATAATDGVSQTVRLPGDFFALVAVDYQSSADYYAPLEDIDARELPSAQGSTSQAFWYRLVGCDLALYPLPAVGTYRITYVPAPAKLTLDTQVVDGVAGWEDGILFEAAIRVALKQDPQSVPAGYIRERDVIWERIQEEAQLRNMHRHRRIIRRPPWRRRPSDYEDGLRFDPSDYWWR